MYYTNKKDLAKHKEHIKIYYDKMSFIKKEIDIKGKIMRTASIGAIIFIFSLIILSIFS